MYHPCATEASGDGFVVGGGACDCREIKSGAVEALEVFGIRARTKPHAARGKPRLDRTAYVLKWCGIHGTLFDLGAKCRELGFALGRILLDRRVLEQMLLSAPCPDRCAGDG